MWSCFLVKYLKHFLEAVDSVPLELFIKSAPCSIKLSFVWGLDWVAGAAAGAAGWVIVVAEI